MLSRVTPVVAHACGAHASDANESCGAAYRTLICGTVRVVSYHWLSKVHELFLSKIFDWHDANQLGLFQCFHLHIESQSSAKPACLEQHRTNMANDGCTVKKSRALQMSREHQEEEDCDHRTGVQRKGTCRVDSGNAFRVGK